MVLFMHLPNTIHTSMVSSAFKSDEKMRIFLSDPAVQKLQQKRKVQTNTKRLFDDILFSVLTSSKLPENFGKCEKRCGRIP